MVSIFFSTTVFAINILSASVPPDVKKISPGSQDKISATLDLDFSIADLISLPLLCIDDGFPNPFSIYGIILSNTFFSIGVVAALSK